MIYLAYPLNNTLPKRFVRFNIDKVQQGKGGEISNTDHDQKTAEQRAENDRQSAQGDHWHESVQIGVFMSQRRVTGGPLLFCCRSISFRSVVLWFLDNPRPSRVVARLRARINRRVPTLTVCNEPSSTQRKSVVLPIPVISQNSAIVYVTRVSSTMRFSRGRRGLGSIDAHRVVHYCSFKGTTTAPLRGDEAGPYAGSQITHKWGGPFMRSTSRFN